MATDTQDNQSALNLAFLLVSIAIVAGSIIGYYVAGDPAFDVHAVVRVIGLLVGCGAGVAVFMQTSYGKVCWDYVKGARVEMRRVIWPTRKETLQTTGMILLFVFIVALGLWGVDSILIVLLELFMGTRA